MVTYLIFLSLFSKNLPSILTASTLSPLSEFISIIVLQVSYRIALPTFFVLSVLVATCVHKAVIYSVLQQERTIIITEL